MKAVCITRRGGPQVLEFVEMPVPTPRPREVLIRVRAAGVSYADVSIRRGVYPLPTRLPYVPGYDVVGDVVALGSRAKNATLGQRVLALVMRGGYAEYVTARDDCIVPVPARVAPELAVSLGLNYTTAYQMLHRVARVKAGHTIVVHNAAGGVGSALTELGRLAGAKVYGTASPSKHNMVRGLGAYPVDSGAGDVVDRLRALEPAGFDAAFEGLGYGWWPTWRLLRRGGVLVAYGLGTLERNQVALAWHLARRASALAVMNAAPCRRRAALYSLPIALKLYPRRVVEDLNALVRLLEAGRIQPVHVVSLPLSQARHAHELLEHRAVLGKLVLVPDA